MPTGFTEGYIQLQPKYSMAAPGAGDHQIINLLIHTYIYSFCKIRIKLYSQKYQNIFTYLTISSIFALSNNSLDIYML